MRKASTAIPLNAALDATPAHPYVSRGGVKLAHALAQSGIRVADRVCLDVGASTGGFSHVLLAAGARRVYAIDVGTAQLHASLRNNPKIVSMENTDIRQRTSAQLSEPPDFAVIDVSFISLRHVIPATLTLLTRPAELIALVKPQFEVSRGRHEKRRRARRRRARARCARKLPHLSSTLGCDIIAQFPSPIAGGDGNREFFIAARDIVVGTSNSPYAVR